MLIKIVVIFILITITEKIILLFQYKITKAGFDHFFHFALIQDIKKNRNKFVSKTSSYIIYDNFAYPQFYHWLFSFLPEKFIREKYNKVGQFINFLTLATFVFFAYKVYDFLDIQISRELFVLYSGLAFTLSPFNYLLWNAKNRGLSVRGFGLMLGFLYLYCIVWLNLYNNNWFYLPIYFLVFMILLSSQFTFQFVLLASPLLAIFYKDIFLIFPPFVAALLYLIFFRKIAISFFKGQYYHKKIWIKYIAKNDILKRRFSIYRDFIYEFWKKKDIKYIIDNPIVAIVLGFPFLSVLVFFIAKNFIIKSTEFTLTGNILVLIIPVFVALIAFLVTSFRPTRFFGEPERYVEFALPLFSILAVSYLQNFIWLFVVLICFSFVYLIYQYSLFGFNKEETKFHINIENIKKIISQNSQKDFYLTFSNNISVLNFLIDNDKFKILSPNITSLYTGSVHIKDIYVKGFPYVNTSVLIPLIKEFNIEWFILETENLKKDDFELLDKKNLIFEKVHQEDLFVIYKISKNAKS